MNKDNDTVTEVVEQGKDLLQKANSRHIIIRKANGEKLVDVTFAVAGVVALLLLWIQPFGTLLIIGGVVYGLYSKVKLEIVRELGTGDNVVEMRVPDEDDTQL